MATTGLPHVAGREIAYCFNCRNEWYHTTGHPPQLRCLNCLNDCVELVSQDDDNDARRFQEEPVRSAPVGSPEEPARSSTMNFLRYQEYTRRTQHEADRRMRETQARLDAMGTFDPPYYNQDYPHGQDEDDDDALESSEGEGEYSDPDEADIEEEEFHDPGNFDMYRTTYTFLPGRSTQQAGDRPSGHRRQHGPGIDHGPNPTASAQRPQVTDPADPSSLFSSFANFLTGYRHSHLARPGGTGPDGSEFLHQPPRQRTNTSTFTSARHPGGATSFTIATGPIPIPPGPLGGGWDFDAFFRNVIVDTTPPHPGDDQNRNERDGADGSNALRPALPADLQTILASVLHPHNGDMVDADEAMDRIVSMLMDADPGPGAAPPATQQALDHLERKEVDAQMLGPEGSAECTICIADVTLNEEVLSLPCKHWFHEECVVMWLKQHNTCPVCRRPVEDRSSTQGSGESGSNPGSNRAENNNASNTSNAQTGNATAGSGSTGPQNPPDFYRGNGRYVFVNLTPLRGAANGGGARGSPAAAATDNGNHHGVDANWTQNLNNFLSPMLGVRGPNPAADQGQPWPQWTPLWHRQQTDLLERERLSREQHLAEHQRIAQQQRERLEAIRRVAGLLPSHYRSSRTPERAAGAAERERRRRDSHSPNPGLNFPSRRYNNGSSQYHRNGGLDGSGDEPPARASRDRSRARHADRHARDHDERDRVRPDRLERNRAASIFNWDPTLGSGDQPITAMSFTSDPAPSSPGSASSPSHHRNDGSSSAQGQHRGGDDITGGSRNNGGGFFGNILRGFSSNSNSNNQSSNTRRRS